MCYITLVQTANRDRPHFDFVKGSTEYLTPNNGRTTPSLLPAPGNSDTHLKLCSV